VGLPQQKSGPCVVNEFRHRSCLNSPGSLKSNGLKNSLPPIVSPFFFGLGIPHSRRRFKKKKRFQMFQGCERFNLVGNLRIILSTGPLEGCYLPLPCLIPRHAEKLWSVMPFFPLKFDSSEGGIVSRGQTEISHGHLVNGFPSSWVMILMLDCCQLGASCENMKNTSQKPW